METNLATQDDIKNLVSSEQKVTEEAYRSIVTTGEWLPRIALLGDTSELVKKDKAKHGEYVLFTGAEEYINLSAEFDFICLGMRLKATDISNKDNIVSNYDQKSETFKKIQDMSDNGPPMNGNIYGPEFLCYIPKVEKFSLLHCMNKTMRRESNNLYKLIGNGATAKSHLIETTKNSWWGPLFLPCSSPLQPPPLDKIKDQLTKFNNPDTSHQAEVAPTPVGEQRAR